MRIAAKPLLTVLAFALFIDGCVISQRIIVKFPDDADWRVDYFDAAGEYLGFGKATVTFNQEERSFSMSIVENAFGDTAKIDGVVEAVEAGANLVPFSGKGRWFSEESFHFEGDFDSNMSRIYGCSLACLRIKRPEYDELANALGVCRQALAVSGVAADADAGHKSPVGRKLGKEYMDLVYTFGARKSP